MLLRRRLPADAVRAAPATDARAWNRSGLVLAANAVLGIVSQRGDLVLVGLLAGPADAGVYGVAISAASVPAVALMAGTAPLAPLVARLHALGRRESLAHAVRSTTRTIFAATLAIAAVFAATGPLTLDLLGSRYGAGAGALALLCLAAVVNAAFAANTLALLMTGHERAAATATGAGAATTVVAALVLVPALGIDGGALAALAGVVVRNALATRSAWTTLGLDTSLRGARRR
jgi:O-antigen/teichoic acid export membrane protein